MPETKYAYVDPATGEGYYPHHNDDGEVDWDAVREALAELAEADLADEVKEEIRKHLLAHLQEAGEEVVGEEPRRDVLELEARLAALDRKNRDLRRELRRMQVEHRHQREAEVEAEVAAFVAEGKLVPAAAPMVRAILAAGDRVALNLEGERTNVARLMREVLEATPAVVDFGERLTLEPPAERVPLSPAEKGMLASLGINETDFRRWGGK